MDNHQSIQHSKLLSMAFTTPLSIPTLRSHSYLSLTTIPKTKSLVSRRRPRTSAVQLPDPKPPTDSNSKFSKNYSINDSDSNPLSPISSQSSSYIYKIPVQSPSEDDPFSDSIQDDQFSISSQTDQQNDNDNNNIITSTSKFQLFYQWLTGTTPEGRAIRLTAAASAAFFIFSQIYTQFEVSPSFPDSLDMPSATNSLLSAVTSFIEGPHFAVAAGMGLSALIQSLTGFGFAIVSVGALTQVPWIANSSVFNAIQPVAATLGAITGWILLFPELKKVAFKDISILLIASTLTTPLGALLLEYFDADLLIRGLGALISGYVLYTILGVELPKKLGGPSGAWGLGFLAGALGGAFDITGPPLVLYGDAAGWDSGKGDFRRNVLAVVSVNSTLVVLWDLFSGRLNDYYYYDFIGYALPTTVLGIIIGKILTQRLNPATFKKVVLATCMIMGVKLLIS